MIEFPLKSPLTFFVRLRGERGERELRATLNPFASHTLVPYKDALRLGYTVVFDPAAPSPGDGRVAIGFQGPMELSPITLSEVWLGDLVARNVEALVYDLPAYLGLDIVLGESFLKNFTVTLDYKRRVVRIE